MKSLPGSSKPRGPGRPAPWERSDPHPERAVVCGRDEFAMQREVTEQLKETFPASDAVNFAGVRRRWRAGGGRS
jgi:hypothetical protein